MLLLQEFEYKPNEDKSLKDQAKDFVGTMAVSNAVKDEKLVEDTAKSLKISIKAEINELKRKLSTTDYIVLKIAEETAYGNDKEVERLKTEYSTKLANRQVWRDRINELEKGV